MASRKSFQTPQDRKSMLGYGKASSAMMKSGKVPESKKLSFSANKSRNSSVVSSSVKRWSASGTTTKDPRQLSNRSFQRQMIEDILDFLKESGYPHSINVKILSAPTTKEFLRVFEHLHGFINPNFKMEKKFEEEIPKILKQIGYPYTISKSAMFAIGNMHSWPNLLGALQWMVEVIRTANQVDVEDMLFPESFFEGRSGKQDKIFFTYFTNIYEEFLLGADEHEEANALLEKVTIAEAGCSEEDYEALKVEVEDLEKEIAALETEPDVLVEAEKERAWLLENIEQEELKIASLQQKKKVTIQQYRQYEQQIQEEGLGDVQLGDPSKQEEIKHKSAEVKRELDRLNAERERLEALNEEREMRFARMYDKVQSTVNEYNDIARDIAINPFVVKYVGENTIELKFDHNQKDMSKSSLSDCRERLKPLLVKLSSRVAEDRHLIESQKITEEEKLDRLIELNAEKKHELERLKISLQTLESEVTDKKENLVRDYEGRELKLTKQRNLMAEERKKMNKKLEETKQLLMQDRIEFEQKEAEMTREEEQYAEFLIQLCHKIEEHKQEIKKRMTDFKDQLHLKIKEVESAPRGNMEQWIAEKYLNNGPEVEKDPSSAGE